MLHLSHVTKSFSGTASGQTVNVLEDVSLQLPAGDTRAIIGPSGSGKSTLLNIIGTLDRATHGEVRLDNEDLGHLDEKALAALRNRKIGFIFQAHHLLPQCTVMENVLVPTIARGAESLREGAEERARTLLERVGLAHRLTHRPGELSGGERQRVAVVRALINRPKLLLADEPTGALDRASAASMGQLLVELNQEEKVTLIVVTHALELARRMARIHELRDGTLHDWTEAA